MGLFFVYQYRNTEVNTVNFSDKSQPTFIEVLICTYMVHALACGIPPSSVVELFSTVMNNSGFKSINSISVWISVYRQI